jgi:hypothetical protein
VDWIDLLSWKDKRRAVVKTVLNLGDYEYYLFKNDSVSCNQLLDRRRDSICLCGRSLAHHNVRISPGDLTSNLFVIMRPEREPDHSPPSRDASTLRPTYNTYWPMPADTFPFFSQKILFNSPPLTPSSCALTVWSLCFNPLKTKRICSI